MTPLPISGVDTRTAAPTQGSARVFYPGERSNRNRLMGTIRGHDLRETQHELCTSDSAGENDNIAAHWKRSSLSGRSSADAGKESQQPGFDPILGQAKGGAPRFMDEPVPNYPVGNMRSRLDMPAPFVVPTAGAYFFVPSITALHTVLTDGVNS